MSEQNIKNNVEIQTKIDYEKKFKDLKLDNIGIRKNTLLNVLIDYNNKAVDRADQYVNQKRINLEINLTMVLITFAIVTVILDTLNNIEVSILVGILVIYCWILLVNLVYNLLAQKTKFNFYYFPKFFYEEKGKDLLLNVYFYNKVKLFK